MYLSGEAILIGILLAFIIGFIMGVKMTRPSIR